MVSKTVKELCEELDIDYATGNALVKLAVASGQATIEGKRPAKGGKGMPSIIYSLPNEITISLVKKPEKAVEAA